MEYRRGWGVVAGGFFALAISGGIGFYALAVMVETILTDLGWSLTQFSVGILLWGLTGAVASPLIGKWIDRAGSRPVMCVGVVITFVATLGLGLMSSLPVFYALLMLGAVGSLCNTYIPVAAVIAHWFSDHRGTATGIAMLGLGLGGLVVPLAAEALVGAYGWRTAIMILAGGSLLAFVPILLGIREPATGAHREEETNTPGDPVHDLDLRQAWRTRTFWGLSLGDGLAGAMFAIFNVHLVLYLSTDLGDAAGAVKVYGALNVCLALGTIVFGALADTLPLRLLVVVCYALPAAGVALLIAPAAAGLAFAFAVLAGLAGGGRQALFPVALMHGFGPTHTAAIYGLSNSFFFVGNALGPVVAAVLYDLTGDTRVVYGAVAGALALSALLVSLMRREAPGSVTE
jgi:MFS family permease